MPQYKRKFVTILAMSPAACAHALGLSEQCIQAAISSGALGPVRVIGMKHRISVADIERWFNTLPIAKKRKTAHASI